ncbi:MAG: protein kinase [Candidatus Acidiferrales bacterium]
MAERTDTNRGLSGPPKQAARGEQQDTMLLGDVPDVSELMPEASDQATLPHLSSVALAALSQRYEILGEAGHGSMGNVYKARDRETGEIVALKLLKPEIASDQAMMDRFKNELLFARKITHKNVCRVHEFNRLGGIAYTSMEFVEGESLRSVLNRFGGLPVRKATDLVLQICSGLREAHAQGIVHRDLKPENIMIDAQGNVKIMDFGIARSMEAVTRMTGSMVGTPAYMAPEQVAGKPVDYRTDIYSLGLILYEMFTGTAAFRADNAVAVALKQMRESPVPPHEIDPQIPVPIERAILKCLEKEPSKRFQSIAELESALRPQGTAPAALTGAPPARVSSTHSTQATLPLPSPPLRLMAPPRKRVSPAVWVLLLVLVALAAVAGERSAQIRQATAMLPRPAPLPAPKPPAFAFDIPPRQAAQPPSALPLPVPKPVMAKPEKPAVARPAQPASPPQDVQQRADKAFGKSQSGGAFTGLDNRPGYVWVGRFEREDRARGAAKKIEDLGGLSARVVSRQNESGKFFVVWTGPFAAKSLPGILDWLQAQGFAKARAVRTPGNGTMGLRDQGQNGEPWGKTNPAPNP